MDFAKLKKNIIDVIKEEQVKLGFQRETIRLYYPLDSLNVFLGAKMDTEEMKEAMKEFVACVRADFGDLEITNRAERFCLKFPPETAEYVNENTPKEGFLYDLVAAVSEHGTTIERVLQCFYRYSDRVIVEKVSNGEFDYLVYFEDDQPDDYRYCLTDEGHHVIYHRYTKEDFKELGLL